MLKLLSLIPLAQIYMPGTPAIELPRIQQIVEPQEVRVLPGQLDTVPVFNSNSPEVVQQEGILLSTFPPTGMRVPAAHLNYAFEGRFDIFAHHIARGVTPDDARTLFIGILVHNPTARPVTIEVRQAVSYLSQEAPFYDLPSYVANASSSVFAGPGSRTMGDILRGLSQSILADRVVVSPGQTQLLLSEPIPLRSLASFRNGEPLPVLVEPAEAELDAAEDPDPLGTIEPGAVPVLPPRNREIPINGRTTLMYLSSDGPVHVASLGMFGRINQNGSERSPRINEWLAMLQQGNLAGPRDRAPTSPNSRRLNRFYYGRVAGVAQGSLWQARLTDSPEVDRLTIPKVGQSLSYAISTVDRHTLGTGQVQSAPMLARYPDTAYRAHGNYGIHYDLSLPLYNDTNSAQRVSVLFQTPMKDEGLRGQALRFLRPTDRRIFFRGTLRLRYTNDWGVSQTRYVHIVQRRGQQGEPLLTLELQRGDRRLVQVDFLYPPDATPPQALTIRTLNPNEMPVPNSPSTEPGAAITLERSP